MDILSTRVDIVSELHRLSEGDPLLIRLYVDDLWTRGEAALRLQPEDLHAISPGLVGYFERRWNDQRLLWTRDAPQREVAVQSVLNLLVGALGPLSQADILNLAPREAGLNTENLAQYLEPLARFVIGNGTHQGYVFSHPRLASYFLEERLILKALIPYLSPERRAGILGELKTSPHLRERLEILETLLPYLSEKQCVEALEILHPPQPKDRQSGVWVRLLAALTPRLPGEQFLALWLTLLQTARQTRSDEDRVWILTWLAARRPKNMLPELLEILWSIRLQGGQEKVLAALLPALEPGGWREVLALATAKTRVTGETRVLVQLLKAADALAQPPSPSLLYPALHDLLYRLTQNTRPEALADLTPLAATIRALGGEAAIREACCAVLEVGYWWP